MAENITPEETAEMWRQAEARTPDWNLGGLYCRRTDHVHLTLKDITTDMQIGLLSDGTSSPLSNLEVIGPGHVHEEERWSDDGGH